MTDTTFEHWFAGLFGTSRSEVERLLGDKTALQFLIAWSLFESLCFSGFVKDEGIRTFAERLPKEKGLDVTAIRLHANYLHRRYQDKALYMNLVRDDKSTKGKSSLSQLRTEIDDILKLPFVVLNDAQTVAFSTFVVYRFRNNIFHGNKGVLSWLKFTKQICRCTRIMRTLISHAETLQCRLKST